MLVIIGGLPATGKTTLSRLLARDLTAVHLRIDTIEQAIVRSGLARQPLGPVGYDIGYSLAGDFLRQGLTVLAESVNPLELTRAAWRSVAEQAGCPAVEVEVICSDPDEHRRRATGRTVDIADLRPPTWQEICDREYEPWGRDHVVVDTAGRPVEECVAEVRKAI